LGHPVILAAARARVSARKKGAVRRAKSRPACYTLEALSRVCTLERSGSHTSARGLVKRNDGAKEQEGSEGEKGEEGAGFESESESRSAALRKLGETVSNTCAT